MARCFPWRLEAAALRPGMARPTQDSPRKRRPRHRSWPCPSRPLSHLRPSPSPVTVPFPIPVLLPSPAYVPFPMLRPVYYQRRREEKVPSASLVPVRPSPVQVMSVSGVRCQADVRSGCVARQRGTRRDLPAVAR